MLELDEAVARILAALPPPTSENVPLHQAQRRFLAETVPSPVDLPLFDNSAMDGYAVRSADLAGAASDRPVRLRLAGKAAAGTPFTGALQPGDCVRLFTGSLLPAGADSVIMQEDTRVPEDMPGTVLALEPTKPWEHVRLQGEEVKKGAVLARAGEPINATRAGLLAAAGFRELPVARAPIVSLLSTGTELREPGQPLEPGQIYESNRAALEPLIQATGARVRSQPLVSDSLSGTRAAIEKAFTECDVLITSGGVSVGEMDFVREAFEQAGGRVEFWKVSIKPGRPFVWGRRGNQFLFGLPGNPVSAFVTFLLLARPALLRWQGAIETDLASTAGTLMEPAANPGSRRHFLRVHVGPQGEVRLAGLQASHALSSLAAANALLDLAPNQTLSAGSQVRVIQWD